jgi:hypothetical protein
MYMKLIIKSIDEIEAIVKDSLPYPFNLGTIEVEVQIAPTHNTSYGDLETIRMRIEAGEQIQAIKRLRLAYPKMGLRCAKEACDALKLAFNNESPKSPEPMVGLSYSIIVALHDHSYEVSTTTSNTAFIQALNNFRDALNSLKKFY